MTGRGSWRDTGASRSVRPGRFFPFAAHQNLLLFPDLFAALGPVVVALQTEDGHPGGENGPEVVCHGAGEMVKAVKGRQVGHMGQAAAGGLPHGQAGENEDDGGEAVDDQRHADQGDRRGGAEQAMNLFRQGGQVSKIVQGADADGDEQGQSADSPAGAKPQFTDLPPRFPAAARRLRGLLGAHGALRQIGHRSFPAPAGDNPRE